jgi:hypothetical protein
LVRWGSGKKRRRPVRRIEGERVVGGLEEWGKGRKRGLAVGGTDCQ